MAITTYTANGAVISGGSSGDLTPTEIGTAAGQTAGITSLSYSGSYATEVTQNGTNYGYALIVQLPVPVIKIDLKALGNFVLPKLTGSKIPQALQWLLANEAAFFAKLQAVAFNLVKVIPNASVIIQVKAGKLTLLNVLLVAQKTPVAVPLPSFIFDVSSLMPSLSGVSLPFSPPSIAIAVPVPVPIAIPPSAALVLYGQVIAGVTSSGSVVSSPLTSAVRLPII